MFEAIYGIGLFGLHYLRSNFILVGASIVSIIIGIKIRNEHKIAGRVAFYGGIVAMLFPLLLPLVIGSLGALAYVKRQKLLQGIVSLGLVIGGYWMYKNKENKKVGMGLLIAGLIGVGYYFVIPAILFTELTYLIQRI